MDRPTKTITVFWDGVYWREQATHTIVTGVPGSWDDSIDGPRLVDLQPLQWRGDLSGREQAQINHAVAYAHNHADAGAPGHGQFTLIAKLAEKLDDLERRTAHLLIGPE